MGRRGIVLSGRAAGAIFDVLAGKAPVTEDDKHLRVATFVHFHMKAHTKDGETRAKKIIAHLAKHGLDKTLEALA